jgi:uncharacterized protein
MKIWVDADACPVAIREILYRAAERKRIELILVANQHLSLPGSRYIRLVQVSSGFDVADNEIVKRVQEGDLVITSDIPLASEVIDRKGRALSPRGELFTDQNVKSRLNMRDFMDTLRASGIHGGGPPALSQRDRQNFANHLDSILAKAADVCSSDRPRYDSVPLTLRPDSADTGGGHIAGTEAALAARVWAAAPCCSPTTSRPLGRCPATRPSAGSARATWCKEVDALGGHGAGHGPGRNPVSYPECQQGAGGARHPRAG